MGTQGSNKHGNLIFLLLFFNVVFMVLNWAN